MRSFELIGVTAVALVLAVGIYNVVLWLLRRIGKYWRE